MRKKFFLYVLVIVLCVIIPRSLFAAIEITEIMYDLKDTSDTDHEWVEVHNTGNAAVDLSKYKFSDGSSHTLNVPPENGGQGSIIIAADGYAILAAKADVFVSDHSGFTGTVIDTVMSLNNSGDTLKILDDAGTAADSVVYASDQGAAGDGNSLQKKGTVWIAADPTPGQAATGASSGTNTTTNTPTGTTTQSGGTAVQTVSFPPAPPRMIASIEMPEYATAGLSLKVTTKAKGYSKEDIVHGVFRWNMGDGMERETTENREPFEYTYAYPGEYVVIFEHYANTYALEPDVKARLLISVVASQTVIKEVHPDGAVVLENKSDYEIDLSKWMLSTPRGKSFTIPKNTFILPNHELVLGPLRSGFTAGDTAVTLVSPMGEVESVYPPAKAGTFTAVPIPAAPYLSAATHASVSQVSSISKKDVPLMIPPTALEANPLMADTDIAKAKGDSPSSRTILPIVLFALLAAAVIGGTIAVSRVQHAKRKSELLSESEKQASEFEIVD